MMRKRPLWLLRGSSFNGRTPPRKGPRDEAFRGAGGRGTSREFGHATVALVIDTADLLPPARDRLDGVARRIWLAQREAERRALERAGIPTALVSGVGGVRAAVMSLRRRMGHLLQPMRGVAITAQQAREEVLSA